MCAQPGPRKVLACGRRWCLCGHTLGIASLIGERPERSSVSRGWVRAHLDTATKLPLLHAMEERARERRHPFRNHFADCEEAPLPALRCGERESCLVVVPRCARWVMNQSYARPSHSKLRTVVPIPGRCMASGRRSLAASSRSRFFAIQSAALSRVTEGVSYAQRYWIRQEAV